MLCFQHGLGRCCTSNSQHGFDDRKSSGGSQNGKKLGEIYGAYYESGEIGHRAVFLKGNGISRANIAKVRVSNKASRAKDSRGSSSNIDSGMVISVVCNIQYWVSFIR